MLALSYTPPIRPTLPFGSMVPVKVKSCNKGLWLNADMVNTVSASPALGPETLTLLSFMVNIKLYLLSFMPKKEVAYATAVCADWIVLVPTLDGPVMAILPFPAVTFSEIVVRVPLLTLINTAGAYMYAVPMLSLLASTEPNIATSITPTNRAFASMLSFFCFKV